MKKPDAIITTIILAATTLSTGPALAQSANWTGVYVGAEFGGVDAELTSPPIFKFDERGATGGLIAGYDYDLGDIVIGAGVDINFASTNIIPGLDLKRMLWLKLRGGYKVGNGLIYITGGYVDITFNNNRDDHGYFMGGGYEHLIKSNISIGGEILFGQSDNFAGFSGNDVELITYQIRAAYRF